MFNSGDVVDLSRVIKDVFNDYIDSKGLSNSNSYKNYIENINKTKKEVSTDSFTNHLIDFINE